MGVSSHRRAAVREPEIPREDDLTREVSVLTSAIEELQRLGQAERAAVEPLRLAPEERPRPVAAPSAPGQGEIDDARRTELDRVEERIWRSMAAARQDLVEYVTELVERQVAERVAEATAAAEDGLRRRAVQLRAWSEQARYQAEERIKEAEQRLSRRARRREIKLARQERDRKISAAERRLSRRGENLEVQLGQQAADTERRIQIARQELEGRLQQVAEGLEGIAQRFGVAASVGSPDDDAHDIAERMSAVQDQMSEATPQQ